VAAAMAARCRATHTDGMLIRTTLALLLLLSCAVAHAHHGWSGYDESKPVTLSGTIERSTWSNPHGTIQLKTADASWKVILAPVARMKSRGMSPDMVAKGAKVSVVGSAPREQKGELRAERITIGKSTFELR
jgi:Family of unknown function (DUF6152)